MRHIEAGLPSETWDVWAKRGSVDFVVLLDWSCGEKDLTTGTPLCSLKDAIYKVSLQLILVNVAADTPHHSLIDTI